MRDFLSLAKKRKSTFEFDGGKVSDADLDKMLESAIWAPNCANIQPWHFIVIRDKNKIEKVMRTANYGFFHGTNPSVIIAAVLLHAKCAGPGFACFRGNDSAVHDTFMCIGIAVQNMTLTATDLGIDSAILTPKQKEIKSLLGVNPSDNVPVFLALGKERKGAFKRKRERYPLSDVVTLESFGGAKWIKK